MNDDNHFKPKYYNILKVIRSIGQKPADALRDIGDNGFDAESPEIRIWINEKKLSDDEKRQKKAKQVDNIVIVDYGNGMNTFELLKSLVPGDTGRERNLDDDLGLYGVGLLASGLSLSNRIEIYTRGEDGDLFTYVDYSEKCRTLDPVNVVRKATADETRLWIKPYIESRKHSTGTIVVLSEVNRLPATREVVSDLVKETSFAFARGYYHLRDKISIFVNDQTRPIRYYDPLERDTALNVSPKYTIVVPKDRDGNQINAKITVQFSYIKAENPSYRDFPSLQDPSLKTQGFSIVRNGREIAFAQNFNMWIPTGTGNRFRGLIMFEGKHLDDFVFDTDVKKSDVQIRDKQVWASINKLREEYFRDVVDPLYQSARAENRQIRELKKVTPTNQITISQSSTPKTVVQPTLPLTELPLVKKLKNLNVLALTPLECQNHLFNLKKEAENL